MEVVWSGTPYRNMWVTFALPSTTSSANTRPSNRTSPMIVLPPDRSKQRKQTPTVDKQLAEKQTLNKTPGKEASNKQTGHSVHFLITLTFPSQFLTSLASHSDLPHSAYRHLSIQFLTSLTSFCNLGLLFWPSTLTLSPASRSLFWPIISHSSTSL